MNLRKNCSYLDREKIMQENNLRQLEGLRIGLVWQMDTPWEVRMDKIMISLKKAGAEPHFICRNWSNKPKEETECGIRIHRLPYISWLSSGLNRLLSSRIPLSPLWIIRIRQVIRKEKLDCIIVRDLPLLLTSMIAKSGITLPLILDMAENYPAFLRVRYRRKWYWHCYPWFAGIMERILIKYPDRIFVVAKENLERIVKFGMNPKKVIIVSNTPELKSAIKQGSINANLHKRFEFNFVIVYVGGFDTHRGLEIAIKSMPLVLKEIPNAKLVLVGSGNNEHVLREIGNNLNLNNNVCFEGWVDSTTVPDYLQLADVCIIPHLENEHINTTLPNKLFDYMAYGKPVVVSSAKPLARIVKLEKCGLVFNAGSSEHMAQCLIKLKRSNLLHKLGERGKKALIDKYNWEFDSGRLIKTIRECCAEYQN